MSFLIDPPSLYANGRVTAQLPGRAQRPVAAATLAAFLVTSVSLYANRPWTRWIWGLCRARSGRDWMLNSGVFRFPYGRVGRGTHVVSALLFASYPAFLILGHRHGRRRR